MCSAQRRIPAKLMGTDQIRPSKTDATHLCLSGSQRAASTTEPSKTLKAISATTLVRVVEAVHINGSTLAARIRLPIELEIM
mmetsp:Transcript_33009/g.88515  ORF Transcript_33009/g.88515 Transcript_33009/m.88515 type:complete len:82 (+) Transcript_33009:43-288(+)